MQVELRGYDLDLAEQVANDLQTVMTRVPGIEDVRISRRRAAPSRT